MRYRMRRLSSQIFVAQLLILTATTLVGFLLFARAERHHLDTQFETRAAAIAEAAAGVPRIRSCMAHETPGCASAIQSIASGIAERSGASYVVIIDMHRIRHSHPDPALIGQQVTEPIYTVDGKVHTRVDDGSTGRVVDRRDDPRIRIERLGFRAKVAAFGKRFIDDLEHSPQMALRRRIASALRGR